MEIDGGGGYSFISYWFFPLSFSSYHDGKEKKKRDELRREIDEGRGEG